MAKSVKQTELKQAKQQSQDLHRTGDFFTTLLALGPGEEMPKAPHGRSTEDSKQQSNGIPNPVLHAEAVSPLSQPRAPPPQQPLPEKPDGARFVGSDALNQLSLRRTGTERPSSFSSSPTRLEAHPSQILSLVEALSMAKKEIDSQGDRVKHLETLLRREKKARESAEERARRLIAGQSSPEDGRQDGAIEHDAFEPPVDTAKDLCLQEELNSTSIPVGSRSEPTIVPIPSESPEDLHRQTEKVDASTSRLRERLDQMVRDMDQMKSQMESYKRRAEGAEAERTSLAVMIEKIRAETAGKHSLSNGSIVHPSKHAATKDTSDATSSAVDPGRGAIGLWNGTSSSFSSPSSSLHNRKERNGSATASDLVTEKEPSTNMQALERSMAATLRSYASGAGTAQSRGGGDAAMQSAPYVSMVGVVLIGVGIMTWLNGWQKVER